MLAIVLKYSYMNELVSVSEHTRNSFALQHIYTESYKNII